MDINLFKARKTIFNFVIVFTIASYQLSKWEPAANSSFFNQVTSEIFGPAQSATNNVKLNISSLYNHYLKLVDTAKENDLLKEEVLNLRERIRNYNEVTLENERLKSMLNYETDTNLVKVYAKVISWDNNKDFRVMRLDRGRNSGINLKDAVVTSKGLVGSIFSLSANYSEVLLVTDVNSRIDVLNTRTRARGIIEGYSESSLLLKYTELKKDYLRGDFLITAGLSYLPKGIALGKVSEIKDSAWLSKKRIYIEPAVDLAALEDVTVLIHKDNGKAFRIEDYIEEK